MSMSPDDPDFLTRLTQSLGQGPNSPLMGIAMGLLQAGGPSRMPTSFGQALGQGLQTGQQFQQAGLQNAMQRLMLGKTGLQMNMLQDALGQTQTPAAPQATPQMPPIIGNVSQPGSFDISQGIGQAASTAAPAAPQGPALPARIDPYQDPIYLRNQKLAQIMDMMQPGSGAGFASAAQQRIDYLNKQAVNLTADQAKLLIPGGTVPGQSLEYYPSLGTYQTVGTEAVKPSQGYDQYGNLVSPLTDVRSGKTVGTVSGGIQRKPNTPLPGPLESQAQGLADYTQDLEGISKRGMTGELLKQRAKEINPQWDETTYKAKQALATDFAKGSSGKALLAFNTATSHLDTMAQAAAALQNGDIQTANRISNAFGVQLGKDPVTNFNTVKQLVAGEVAKAIAGGNVAEGDREKANAVLNAVNSPQQLAGAIAQIRNLMGGKIAALKTQYESMGLPNFERKLTPAALASMQNFEAQNESQGSSKTLTYDPSTGGFH